MSVTAEQMMARLDAQRAQGPPGRVSAQDMMARLEATSGLSPEQIQVRMSAAPGAANPPGPPDEPLTMKQVGASFAQPILESIEGIQDLAEEPGQQERMSTYDPVLAQRQGATRRALEWAEENQAPGGAGVAANIAGEAAQMAFPASKMSKGARLLTKGRSVANKVAPITAEAGTVAGYEALKKPEEGETRAENAMDAFTATLGTAAGQKLLSKFVNPQMFKRTEAAKEEARALAGAGIESDIPITLGTKGAGPVSMPAHWALRNALMGLPGTKGKLSGQIEKAYADWRQLMAAQTLPKGAKAPTLPVREGDAPMETTMRGIKQYYKDQYAEILDPHRFPVTGGSLIGDRIATAVSKVPGKGSQEKVAKKVGELLKSEASANGVLSGDGVSKLKKMLREEKNAAAKKRPTMSRGYGNVLEALDDGVVDTLKTFNPEHAARYTGLREPYKHYIVLKDAVGRASRGEIQPKGLREAGLRHARRNKIDELDALYRPETQRAEQVYDIPAKARDSNTFQINALGNLALAGGAGAGASLLHPVGQAYTAAIVGSSALGVPRWGQKYMMGETNPQLYMAELLRKPGMEELSRAARIGGGQYLAE